MRVVGVIAVCACAALACSGSLGKEEMGRAGASGSLGGATGLPTGAGAAGSLAGTNGATVGAGGSGVAQGRGGVGGAEQSGMATGGSGAVCIVPTLPIKCPATLCGNGVRDICQIPSGPSASCSQYSAIELCDGEALGDQTCQRLGFGSGTLACAANCDFDKSGCSECLPQDARLLRCGAAPVGSHPLTFALAANDAEVALAWLEGDGVSPAQLWFARLTPSLDLLTATRIDDPGLAAYQAYLNFTVAVAPLPSGWAILGFVPGEMFLHAIDQAGQPVGRTPLDQRTIQLEAYPMLAARPNGGPLAYWMTTDAVRVAVVSDDGRSVTAPLDLPLGLTVEPRSLNAAFIGGAFHVVTTRGTGTNLSQLRMHRIASDGSDAVAFEALPDVTVSSPSLPAGADDLRVVYLAANNRDFVMQLLDAGGAARGSPVVMASARNVPSTPRAVGFGADTVSLLAGIDLSDGLRVVRVATDGKIAEPVYSITTGAYVSSHSAVRRGPDLVAAWFGSAPWGIRIARVAP